MGRLEGRFLSRRPRGWAAIENNRDGWTLEPKGPALSPIAASPRVRDIGAWITGGVRQSASRGMDARTLASVGRGLPFAPSGRANRPSDEPPSEYLEPLPHPCALHAFVISRSLVVPTRMGYSLGSRRPWRPRTASNSRGQGMGRVGPAATLSRGGPWRGTSSSSTSHRRGSLFGLRSRSREVAINGDGAGLSSGGFLSAPGRKGSYGLDWWTKQPIPRSGAGCL